VSTCLKKAALTLALMTSLCFSSASKALSACCEFRSISKPLGEVERVIVNRYFSKANASDNFQFERIRTDIIFFKENGKIHIYFENAGEINIFTFSGSGKFYFPDVILDRCERCIWVRFETDGVRDGDFVITGEAVAWNGR
jgi:hypothetical protein